MIRYPNIIGKTDAQKLEQMKSYLHQLADELNFQLDKTGSIGSGYPASSVDVAAIAKPVKKDDAISNFNDIKALIIKSADIVNAYSEEISKKLEGEYVAVSDFGTFKETTEAQLTASSAQVSSVLTKQEQIETDIGDMERELRSEIEQTAESIKLEVTDGTPGKTASIKLTVGDDVYTGTIDMTGLVTFTNLEAKGQTIINGDNINTGKIASVNGTAYFDLDRGDLSTQSPEGAAVRLSDGRFYVLDQDGFARIQMGYSALLDISSFGLRDRSGQSLFNLTEQKGVLRLELPSTSELSESQFYAGNPCWRRIGGVLMLSGATNAFYIDLTSEVKNALPIANGGTGAADRVNAMKNLSSIGMNPIASASEDTVSNWVAKGNGYAYFNKFVLNNQPTQRGFLVNKVQDSTIHQEWHTIEQHSKVYVRAGQGSAWVGGSVWEHGQTDFVTATGTSGAWRYWKFNSGLCIAMGQPTVSWSEPSQVVSGQTRSVAALDLSGIFTAVMGGTCSNVHRYVNCFVTTGGGANAQLWATTAVATSTLNVSNFSTTPFVVLFGKWK